MGLRRGEWQRSRRAYRFLVLANDSDESLAFFFAHCSPNERAEDGESKNANEAEPPLNSCYRIGVISDTHGLLRPEALPVLRGSDHIIHAGDVGSAEILEELVRIAPLTAIRGNIDKEPWARTLPETEVVEVGGLSIYVLHNLEQLDLKPEAAGLAAVIYGHSHVPKVETRNGVLYFNPGSAGPRRFKLPVSVGQLIVEDGSVRGEIVAISD